MGIKPEKWFWCKSVCRCLACSSSSCSVCLLECVSATSQNRCNCCLYESPVILLSFIYKMEVDGERTLCSLFCLMHHHQNILLCFWAWSLLLGSAYEMVISQLDFYTLPINFTAGIMIPWVWNSPVSILEYPFVGSRIFHCTAGVPWSSWVVWVLILLRE